MPFVALAKKGRTRLNLPDGKLGAIAAVHTFGDYLIFHPHLHVLAADGLFTPDGRFHCMPAEDLAPAIELFRHRFLQSLRDGKHISPSRLADLLSWKHSGFNIHDGGEKPVPAHDTEGRKRLAEYLLRHPFSLQKITWNATTQTVIYRSKRHHTTTPPSATSRSSKPPTSSPPFFASVPEASNGRPLKSLRKRRMPFVALAKKGGEEGLLMQETYRNFAHMFYAYILRSEQNPERFYYGFSSDLKKRLKVHNQGGNVSTKTGIPWTLAWYGGFESESAASDFERYLKTASGKAFARKRLLRT
jgi:putative endonuclease